MKNYTFMKKFYNIFLTLTLLTTLGVGQMWATYYYRGEKNSWGATAMTNVNGIYSYYSASSGAHQFKISTSTSSYDYNYTYVTSGYKNTDGTDIGDYGKNNCYCWVSGAHYILIFNPNTSVNGTNKPIICAATALPEAGFESAGNTISYYNNVDGDVKSSALDRTNGSTIDLTSKAITSLYLKAFDTKMYQHYEVNLLDATAYHFYYKIHRTAVDPGSTGFTEITSADGYSAGSVTWGSFDGSKYRKPTYYVTANQSLLSGLGSGLYTMSYYFTHVGTTETYRLPSTSSKFNQLKWKISPPATGTQTVTSDGSGSGTSGSPFQLAVGSTLTITVSATQASSDANSVLYVSFDNGSTYSSTTTKSISLTNTTKYSVHIKAKYYNSDDALSGTVYDFGDIYYQGTLTPSLDWAASDPVSPTSAVAGDEITLTVVRANSSANITYQYSTNSGSTWTTIATQAAQTCTFTTPANTGATQNYIFRATMSDGGTKSTGNSSAVPVYGKKTIKVKNTNNWATMKLYLYNDSGEKEAWPGSTSGISSAGGQWKTIVLTSQWPYFILNNDNNGSQIKGEKHYRYTGGDITITDGNCYAISSGTGTTLTLSSADCPTAPTSVTTTAAPTASTNTGMTIKGSIGGNGNDKITSYGFYYGTTTACSTQAQVGTTDKTGDFTKALTGLTAGTTYYFKAYATNGQGTTYGTRYSYKIPYSVTVSKSTGCESITPSAGSYYYNVGFTVTAVAATGYNFSTWTVSGGSTSSPSSPSTGTNTVTFTPTANSATITATYTPKNYTITLDVDEDHKGTVASATTSHTVSYKTVTTNIPNLPTAENGYGLYGYYTGHNGEGTKLINRDGTFVASVAGYTDKDKKWIRDGGVTLYAYYKKAEITDIALDPAAVEWKESGDNYVKANPIIDPTPVGTTTVCWELLYENEDPITGHDAVAYTEGGTKPNQVRFNLGGLAAGNYIIRAKLHLGSSCGGTLLSTFDKTVTITNNFTLTVFYKCGDVTIQSSTEVDALPLTPKSITAPTITGYTFHHWVLGDGVTCTSGTVGSESTPGTATISYTAIFDGSLTAVYTRKRMIYFYNTLSWTGVTVYFYKNNSYWNNTNGTGADQTYTFTNTPYSEGKHGNMTQIDGTNIYYFDCEAAGVNASYTNVVFTELDQHGYGYFAKTGSKKNKVIRRGDYNTNMPMFVPVSQTPVSMNGGLADYYSKGYWMNYPENTGYTLKIYTDPYANNATGAAREILFPYSADLKMPLKLDVEFNDAARHQYWFMIYSNDNIHRGADYTMNQNYHSDVALNSNDKKIEIKTSATGIYTFTLTYNNTESYYISVDYPVGLGDYRIKYNDRAAWSGGTHDASWWHESDIIRKNTGSAAKSDTVSLYVAYGSTPSAKFQKVTAINESTGKVTWSDVASGTVSLSGITEKGVYNFIVSQPAGGASISLEKAEPYTGNFYIRTDCAGSTKWDSYTFSDHLMTYSDFSFSDANSFGEKYSHYYMHWCERGENIKFVVANDYSACISDTLAQDYGNPYKNTDEGGTLKTDGAAAAVNDRYSSNVRFMYNYSTNKISRAYVASSTDKSRLFLVLRANARIDGEDHEALHDQDVTNGVILKDDQNWIYEEILYITPNTKFKLFASYALQTPSRMDSVQYFRGAYYSGDNKTTCTFNASNSVVLISGSGGMQKARVIYDFKTNRLLAAWIPDGTAVDDPMAINADVLIEREHQEPAQYVTFTDDGALTGVKTIYGAMKFNRWILNNRSNSADDEPDHGKTAEQISTHHPPLAVGSQKSIYERALYFISFPFDVNLGEVFGFGTYGVHWIIEYYDGLTRAKNGYWLDSPPNWKYVMNPNGYTLKANQGYILCLDLDMMQADNFDFWSNGITTVELFFPSTTSNLGTLTEVTDVEIPALSSDYKCTINRPGEDGDRRIKDSYWRCIGVPSLNFYNTEVYKDGEHEQVIGWKTDYSWKGDESEFPFIYKWNMADNTITPQSTSNFSFQPMHSYLVQNGNAIHWTNVSAKPSSIVARRENDYQQIDYNWRLELAKDSQMVDQAYIRMSNLEQVTDTFDFGQDLSKEFNATRSNIYSFIGYEKAAANSMPLKTEQTTIVAIGLNIITAGEYTLGMPDGTDGVGVTLVDSETGTRTNLSALDYTVTLAAGDYTSRFYLEISPVKETPTGLEQLPTTNDQSPIKKLLIDGVLYIVRDGKIFDARGARVE